MTHATKEKRHYAASLAKNKRRTHTTRLKRLQLYAVITGVVSLFMTVIRLIFSLMH